ncbi:hypothetical protein B0H21DRAFT_740529 [Amylocystis lapponica]|nr:hypothetical protein B0H21DRAFT_766808 [Amylocystis lapponica]KAH9947005.1 hypothetical protein B0H21DRAFT_740529 [Amylocystis lapponica]
MPNIVIAMCVLSAGASAGPAEGSGVAARRRACCARVMPPPVFSRTGQRMLLRPATLMTLHHREVGLADVCTNVARGNSGGIRWCFLFRPRYCGG